MNAQKETHRLASIDLGTNTILLLIADIQRDGTFAVVEDQAQITRLGAGVDRTGRLDENAQQRSLIVLRGYAQVCQNLAVDEVVVVGTSALRDAVNREEFRRRLEQECGWKLRVLSGDEEARYSFRAVCGGLDLKGKDVLAIDVGGGSTELIWGRDGALGRWVSLQLGSVRLTERYLVSDPPREEECSQLVAFVDTELEKRCASALASSKPQTTVGIAGTFTTLVAITRGLVCYSHSEVHGFSLTRAEAQRLVALFKGKTAAQRRQIPGLEPGRADVILAGTLLIERIMAFFTMDDVLVSDQGVRYGLLYEKLKDTHGKPIAVTR